MHIQTFVETSADEFKAVEQATSEAQQLLNNLNRSEIFSVQVHTFVSFDTETSEASFCIFTHVITIVYE